ncbi:ThuA domain-containing protein [Algoriphagus halophytocola]|uniref:ThuA domain-containing protein n=1 Tax=Algoriphagus halophytocola TaxID=2991499 RepID=A0ABY6MGS8_9BACT|nr:ThuA domain-containing protein [Algoriphagus sp. TR-M5]UZD22669.1 ThuA domain-containing protein [Algoriphagus sp. TR-M5]
MNFSKNLRSLLLLGLVACLGFLSCNSRSGNPKVLVFSKTAGFYHESIPQGVAAIQKLGSENGFDVDTTTQGSSFNEKNLAQYAAVIFLSTTGDVLDHVQEAEFERYIQSGGGFVGIHAAADTEYHWGWYNKLVGGYFIDHPGINDPHPNVQAGQVNVVDSSHPSTSFLPSPWERTDEWYSYQKMNPEVNILMTLDEDSYQGGYDMGEHPIAWYHDYDGGRAFYTGGGHTSESFSEELYLKHLLAGIEYAIGDNAELDYSKAKSKRVPEANRFSKTMLKVGDFTEPTELTVLPNLDVLISQRRGEILHYNSQTQEITEVAKLDVYWKTSVRGVNAEEGVLGIQKDPDFAENNWVYVYYSPTEKEVNRLSRFKFADGNWDMSSEQIILELYSQRQICCHTGGSIAFGPSGDLFLSTGDNSTPFNQSNTQFTNNGFAPLDGRAGNKQFDARRSSGNANDLRGKIIRIKVKDDGSYDIPAGNLYAPGTEGTKPEIYVQGLRNPYRISIDQKTGFLYWGEVGPDANADSMATRGPRGYDEVNQAREAGHFGWPYVIGNNFPYRQYDYSDGTSGELYDINGPTNDSPNNTGIAQLPPTQPALIWYPYGESKEFPSLGTGGRNAMTGPIYYSDMYSDENKLPDYFDGKLIIYDWVRGWIKLVTLTEEGDYSKMDPFMADTKFNALIDLEMGPDGHLYGLEYGNGWFAKNPDSGLFRIDYNGGNRAPVVKEITADKTSGANPVTVTFTADASDPEGDPMTYTWDLGNGETKTTEEPTLTHTFNETREYMVNVTANDPAGLQGAGIPVSIYSGNIAPEVSVAIKGNQAFYFPGKEVAYEVIVSDEDHPDAASDKDNLYVSADYLEGLDQAEANQGHKILTDAMVGKSLVASLTCKTCHKEAEESIGPDYTSVAKKYTDRDIPYLKKKIREGGAGVWGETAMPANPDLPESELNALISYILSLDQETQPSLPSAGTIDPTLGKTATPTGVLMISASYTDQGGANIKPLTGSSTYLLSSNTVDLGSAVELDGGYSKMAYGGMNLLMVPATPGSFAIANVDLTNISSVTLNTATMAKLTDGFTFELRLDSPDGPVVGTKEYNQGPVSAPEGQPAYEQVNIPITGQADGAMHKLYITSKTLNGGTPGTFILAGLTFNSN